ncbi:hypothetical protein V6R94_06920 [Pediococcus acidilactici]
MSKSSFLLGVIVGGAAATAAAIKLTDTTPTELKEAAMKKLTALWKLTTLIWRA